MISSKSKPQHPSINQNLRNVTEFGYLKFYVGKKYHILHTTFTKTFHKKNTSSKPYGTHWPHSDFSFVVWAAAYVRKNNEINSNKLRITWDDEAMYTFAHFTCKKHYAWFISDYSITEKMFT